MSKNLPKVSLKDKNSIKTSLNNIINEKYVFLLQNHTKENNFFIEEFSLFENMRSTKFLFHYLMDYDKKNETERFLAYTMLKALEKSERICAGSAFFMFWSFLNFFNMEEEKIESYIKTQMSLMKENATASSQHELDLIIDSCFNGKPNWAKDVYKTASQLSGLKGVMSMKTRNVNQLTVEVKTGFRFPVDIPEFYLGGKKSIEINEPKICFVNGMIEKPSELTNILNDAYDTKIPLIIVSQKFSPEVINTIALNVQKGLIRAFPVLIEPSLYTVNQIVDMAVTCDSDPISTLNGELLILKNYSSLKTVSNVVLSKNEIIFENPSAIPSVERHIRSLLEKKRESGEQYKVIDISDYGKVFDMRIEKLLGNIVEIQIPSKWSEQKRNDFISLNDDVLRKMKGYYSHGILPEQCQNLARQLPVQTELFEKTELLLPFYVGMIMARSFNTSITSVENLVTFI
jgi:hypothetical protein